jgi:large subunit ribosomal protein L5
VTTAEDDASVKALLEAYGFPFKRGADAENEPRKKKPKGPRYGGKKKK